MIPAPRTRPHPPGSGRARQDFYDYGIVNRNMGDEAGLWDLMHRLEEYRSYILTVEALRECLSDQDLHSEGLRMLSVFLPE